MIRGSTYLVVVSLVGCGGGPSGPALLPRPEAQTCLPDPSADMPELLSQTGCFSDLATLEVAPELIPYSVNSPLWTDGTYKLRFMVVPNPERIAIDEDGSWSFPEGSVLIKLFGFEFEVGDPQSRRPVETRFMVLSEGEWRFSTYRWNDAGTEAERLSEDATVEYTINDDGEAHVIDYRFPAETECAACHGETSRVLGPKTNQLNGKHDYDGVIENQLVALSAIELLDGVPLDFDPEASPRLVDPAVRKEPIDARARAYLDANCAHCHQPGGFAWSSVDIDLRAEIAWADTRLCGVSMELWEWAGTPRVIPGNGQGSGLHRRFVLESELRMPSSGTSVIDAFGAELIEDWIDRMGPCP